MSALVSSGKKRPDARQQRAAKLLTRLGGVIGGPWWDELQELRRSPPAPPPSLETAPSDAGEEAQMLTQVPPPIPRGLFMHGSVGTGKSFLMDIFFATAPVPTNTKRRVHFHEFMSDVHKDIHALKQRDLAEKGRSWHVDTDPANDPVRRVAKEMAGKTRLLCFDEFQVTDIADAVIISSLFSTLFEAGTVMVATSNRPIDDLYKNGINYDYFKRSIAMLHHHCIEFDMDSATDYRDGAGNALLHFHTGAGGANDEVLAFAGSSSARLSEHTVDVGFGRQLLVKRADVSAGVAVFSFDELCDEYLGAGDYRAVARTFNRIGLLDVPKLTLQDHDQARRFITLVDELYEAGCKLSISAQFEPKLLFEDSGVAGGGEVDLGEDAGGNYAVGGQKWLDVRQATGRMLGELASVRELRFAFQRAASRLTQMTSGEWHGE
ncbi:hypothetical protein TeGR_g12998 [Tetraparma gracilis]|uniref:AFG1-like ATPase n=1 Tax=Tetraparma gracilis TaxID=2962635 RepID=A0ABQ6MUU9_9STRA|nr:hypothetical protein TeGR_g12998 [Tetraparma gracilis]